MRRSNKWLAMVLSVISVVSASWLVSSPVSAAETVSVVALGDSYTAGTGALDYQSNSCFRSSNAYVHRYANELEKLGRAARSHNFACHGAMTGDIAGQLASAASALQSADIVFISVGGNNANFKGIVVNCLAVSRYLHTCHDDVNNALNQLEGIVNSVRNILLDIGQAAPKAQVVLVGYPYLVDDCHTDFNIVRSLQSATDGYYQLLVNSINQTPYATAGRIHYVSMLKPFEGHEVCGDKTQYIRGSLDTATMSEYWHPNREGHLHMARHLVSAGIHKRLPQPPASTTSTTQQQQPSGQYVYKNLPFECGVKVPTATTYDTYNYNGTMFSHGKALDFPMPSGTPVTAPASGTAFVKWEAYGYGRYIDVVEPSGVIHRMAHMQSAVSVANGATIKQGAVIGRVGITGASTGPHLHYERRDGGGQINPNLDGPSLVWSAPSGVSGDRYTIHPLTSGNCGGGGTGSTRFNDEVKVNLAPGGDLSYVHPDGSVRQLFPGIMAPKFRVECDIDGDGRDEIYSAEYRQNKWFVMQATVRTLDSRVWRQFSSDFDGKAIKWLSCGDRDGNGKDEVKVHLGPGGEIRRIGPRGQTHILVKGISRPVQRVECDVDADGSDEIMSLEFRSGQYHLMIAHFSPDGRLNYWGNYIPSKLLNSSEIAAMSCGDSNGDGRYSVKLFFADTHELKLVTTETDKSRRRVVTIWTGLTTPKFMVECDTNYDSIDELYSVEYRGGAWYIMQGIVNRDLGRSWKLFSDDFGDKKITGLSCGNRNGV